MNSLKLNFSDLNLSLSNCLFQDKKSLQMSPNLCSGSLNIFSVFSNLTGCADILSAMLKICRTRSSVSSVSLPNVNWSLSASAKILGFRHRKITFGVTSYFCLQFRCLGHKTLCTMSHTWDQNNKNNNLYLTWLNQ